MMSLEADDKIPHENTEILNNALPVCTQFARTANVTPDLGRLIAELASLPDETRRALASLLAAPNGPSIQSSINEGGDIEHSLPAARLI